LPEPIATMLVSGLGLYVLVGLLVAVFLQVRGLRHLDSQVVGASWRFRLLITPGLIAFWPLLLWRALRGRGDSPPAERNAHRDREKDSS
jgi:hypothetical protein